MYVIIPTMVVLMILDYVTAWMVGSNLQYLETNPIYMVVGSLVPLLLLNIGCILAIWYFYKRSKPFWRYFIVSSFLWHSIVRIFAIRSNVLVYLRPPTPEQVSMITTAVKVNSYALIVLAYALPVVISIITYFIFRVDHNVTQKLD